MEINGECDEIWGQDRKGNTRKGNERNDKRIKVEKERKETGHTEGKTRDGESEGKAER